MTLSDSPAVAVKRSQRDGANSKSHRKSEKGHRFFLSDNEYIVSRSQEHKNGYSFTLLC
jgi:hypothetical protein